MTALNVLLGGRVARQSGPGPERRPVFAPFYDVASSLPYDDMYLPRLRPARRIGSEYRVGAITARHWDTFAERNGLDPEWLMEVERPVGQTAAGCVSRGRCRGHD